MNTYRIIIPVYNPELKFVEFLSQLEAGNPSSLKNLIIVDDGSTNQTMSQVEMAYPDVNIIRGDGSLWWGGAIRLGMQNALENGAQAVVWLNNDCLPDVGSIENLVDLALRPNIGAVGGWCYTRGAEKWGFNPGFIDLKPIPVHDLEDNKLINVHGLNGNFVAVNMKVINSVGLPRTDLFPHYMDGPYTHLIYKNGYKLQVASKLRASLKRDLERSVDVTDYCTVWQASYAIKLKYFFLSRRSPHHLKDKYYRMIAMRLSALAVCIYILSELKVFLNVTSGHLLSRFFPKDKSIENILLKHQKTTPSQQLREALTQLSQRQS